MKLIKRIFLLILLAAVCGVGFITGEGYNMYKQALEKEPVSEKVQTIMEIDNYTEFSELPETYVNAVIAAQTAGNSLYGRGWI